MCFEDTRRLFNLTSQIDKKLDEVKAEQAEQKVSLNNIETELKGFKKLLQDGRS